MTAKVMPFLMRWYRRQTLTICFYLHDFENYSAIDQKRLRVEANAPTSPSAPRTSPYSRRASRRILHSRIAAAV